ncbi:MAG: ATP-binding protein [Proteobacteria bacterium]|nr:ATP-binding protein [Pseudomonadota bacterium]
MRAANPFNYGNPIDDPERFFGRRREVEQIFSRLRNPAFESTSIVGERRTGKTSLLNFVSHPSIAAHYGLDPRTYCFCYIDLQMMHSVEGVSHFVLVAERARRELPVTQLELELQAEIDKFLGKDKEKAA